MRAQSAIHYAIRERMQFVFFIFSFCEMCMQNVFGGELINLHVRFRTAIFGRVHNEYFRNDELAKVRIIGSKHLRVYSENAIISHNLPFMNPFLYNFGNISKQNAVKRIQNDPK